MLLGLAAAGFAQPADMVVYQDRCNDCVECDPSEPTPPGPDSCFREDGGGTTTDTESEDGCQSYAANLYENWNTSNQVAALQTNIRKGRWAFDGNFWYFQIETSANSWGAPPVYVKTHLEVAFDADGQFPCTAGTTPDDGPDTRYSLFVTYSPNTAQIDLTPLDGLQWDNTTVASFEFWRDFPDVDVGGPTNDGPGTPAGNTSDFVDPSTACPTCGGYETQFTPSATSAFARLVDSGGFAQVEIALDRSDFATFLGLADFMPCDVRYWQMQTSTLDKSKVAWNDLFDDDPNGGDLSQESWAMDSCGGALSVPVEAMGFDVD